MKTYNLLIVCFVFFYGCKSEFEEAKEAKAKQIAIKSEHITEDYLFKDFRITVYKDGDLIGSCTYDIKMTPAVIGKDSLWLITEIDDLISKVGGYYLYATPSELKYIKNDDGYAIELGLEAQLAEVDSQVTKLDGDVISFLGVYDALRSNIENVPIVETLTFKDDGFTCLAGNHIRLKKKIYITQHGNTIDIKKEALHIIPSKEFKDAKRYDFLTFDEFPEVLTYDKFRGKKPLYESFKGANGEQIERVSKYDSTEVFDGAIQ